GWIRRASVASGLFCPNAKRPSVRMAFCLIWCLAVYGGRPARHPPGRCFATFKSAPGGFVLLWRAFTDKQQIKQKARSFDRAFCFI
ncbi:hypothetical protein, partial [Escherichia albertii]|uniref:hypothetical protein n=3 Tax=Escherichia albertii TaxID=208962 RepID=UPI001CA965B9